MAAAAVGVVVVVALIVVVAAVCHLQGSASRRCSQWASHRLEDSTPGSTQE